MKHRSLVIAGVLLITIVGNVSVSAQASSAKKSGLWGAGIGAVAGGLLGGNWSDVAVGALAGGGYFVYCSLLLAQEPSTTNGMRAFFASLVQLMVLLLFAVLDAQLAA